MNSLLADVALDSINAKTALKADIGVMNAGGVRADLAAGEVTFADAYQVQPFGNPIGTVDMTGAQFIELLEQQWKPGQSRAHLALGLSSNVTYIYDPAGEQGSRITRVLVNGTPIDPAATYRVAGNRFLLNEGDIFTAFGTQTGSNTFTDTGLMDVDLFISYLAANPNIAPVTSRPPSASTWTEPRRTVPWQRAPRSPSTCPRSPTPVGSPSRRTSPSPWVTRR
nr:5'-nucleotidase [Corynebacterium meridianum]